jgi:aminopeptidase N
MTDSIAAFSLISSENTIQSVEVIEHFYKTWQSNFLVMCKWFAAQAKTTNSDNAFVFDRIKSLSNHPAFDSKNPNMIRSLLGVLANNLALFHDPNLSCYEFLADNIIEIDTFNPQIAASLIKTYKSYKNLNEISRNKMRVSLQLLSSKNLSNDSKEILKLIAD